MDKLTRTRIERKSNVNDTTRNARNDKHDDAHGNDVMNTILFLLFVPIGLLFAQDVAASWDPCAGAPSEYYYQCVASYSQGWGI